MERNSRLKLFIAILLLLFIVASSKEFSTLYVSQMPFLDDGLQYAQDNTKIEEKVSFENEKKLPSIEEDIDETCPLPNDNPMSSNIKWDLGNNHPSFFNRDSLSMQILKNQNEKVDGLCRPSLIIAGSRKGGSSSLYHYLIAHPKVDGPIETEEKRNSPKTGEIYFMGFCDKNNDCSYKDYNANFPSPKEGFKYVESSIGYMSYEPDTFLIAKTCGKNSIDFVFLIREPVARVESQFLMRLRLGTDVYTESTTADSVLMSAADDFFKNPKENSATSYMRCGFYDLHIRRFVNEYGSHKVHVIFSEDFFKKPALYVDSLLRKTLDMDMNGFDVNEVVKGKYNAGTTGGEGDQVIKYDKGIWPPLPHHRISQNLTEWLNDQIVRRHNEMLAVTIMEDGFLRRYIEQSRIEKSGNPLPESWAGSEHILINPDLDEYTEQLTATGSIPLSYYEVRPNKEHAISKDPEDDDGMFRVLSSDSERSSVCIIISKNQYSSLSDIKKDLETTLSNLYHLPNMISFNLHIRIVAWNGMGAVDRGPYPPQNLLDMIKSTVKANVFAKTLVIPLEHGDNPVNYVLFDDPDLPAAGNLLVIDLKTISRSSNEAARMIYFRSTYPETDQIMVIVPTLAPKDRFVLFASSSRKRNEKMLGNEQTLSNAVKNDPFVKDFLASHTNINKYALLSSSTKIIIWNPCLFGYIDCNIAKFSDPNASPFKKKGKNIDLSRYFPSQEYSTELAKRSKYPFKFPRLFIVGCQKCGTSSISLSLSTHPRIIQLGQESHAFDFCCGILSTFRSIDIAGKPIATVIRKAKGWYLKGLAKTGKTFPFKSGVRKVTVGDPGFVGLDKSPTYLYIPGISSMIRRVVPSARIIIILRDPVERAFSGYLHFMRHTVEYSTIGRKFVSCKDDGAALCDFEQEIKIEMEAIKNCFGESPKRNILNLEADVQLYRNCFPKVLFSGPRKVHENQESNIFKPTQSTFLHRGLYYYQVLAYALEFPPEQVQVYFFNDFAKDAKAKSDEVIAHALKFAGLEECKVVVGAATKSESIVEKLNEEVNEQRKGKDHPHIKELEQKGISSEIEKQLREFYKPYNKMLEELLGTKLPWN